MASKLANVSSKQVNAQIARLEEAKSVAEKQKGLYVKVFFLKVNLATLESSRDKSKMIDFVCISLNVTAKPNSKTRYTHVLSPSFLGGRPFKRVTAVGQRTNSNSGIN